MLFQNSRRVEGVEARLPLALFGYAILFQNSRRVEGVEAAQDRGQEAGQDGFRTLGESKALKPDAVAAAATFAEFQNSRRVEGVEAVPGARARGGHLVSELSASRRR